MRVLHLIPSVHSRYGGPSQAVRLMAMFQSSAGIQADIATTHQVRVERKDASHEDEIRPRVFSFSSQLGEYKFSLGLWRWLQENLQNYHILHIHSVFCFSTAMAATLARKFKIPYIVRPLGQLYPWALNNRSGLLKKVYLSLFEYKTICRADALHFTAEHELHHCGIPINTTKSYVLPLGSEPLQSISKTKALALYPQLKDKRILLFLSRIHPKKGLSLVLPWLGEVLMQRPGWVIVIAGAAGDHSYLESLKKLIRQRGFLSQVFFVGQVSDENKAALYNLADLFVLPSHSENFGIALVDALAAGVPVLTSDQVGICETIVNNQAGLVFRLNESDFSFAVTRLMDDANLRQEMSTKAKALAQTEFDWKLITVKQIERYEAIIKLSATSQKYVA